MLKQDIKFKDFNGTERTQTLYFNLTEFEIADMQAHSERGIQADLEDAIANKNVAQILDFIKMLVHKSYGIKSEDGLHFRKSPEIIADFESSALYSDLLLHLFQDGGNRGVQFITGLMPADLVRGASQKVNPNGGNVEKSARERFEERQKEKNIPAAVPVDFTRGSAAGIAEEIIDGLIAVTPQTQGEVVENTFPSDAHRIDMAQPSEPVQPNPPAEPEPTPVPQHVPDSRPFVPGQGGNIFGETPEEKERREFEEWKRSRETGEQDAGVLGRPPHESGPGFQLND